jgi:MerR family transcriptional regulator, heat shock protein HspR
MLHASPRAKILSSEEVGMAQPTSERARGVYGISVAAELTGAGVQNLRVYERRGLVEPGRTEGGTRRYSEDDLDRVRRVLALLDAGLNLAGIALVLDLQDDNARLRRLARER